MVARDLEESFNVVSNDRILSIHIHLELALVAVYACNPSTEEAKAVGTPESQETETSLGNIAKPHLHLNKTNRKNAFERC